MGVIASEGQILAVQRPWTPITNTSSVRLYGDFTYDYGTIYEKQPSVRRVVDFLAKNIAQLGIKAYRRVSDTDRQHLTDHPLTDVLLRPNQYTTRFRFIKEIISDRAIYDDCYILKVRQPDSGRLALVRVPVPHIEIKGENWLRPDMYVLVGNRKRYEIDPEDVIRFPGYHPSDPRKSISPLETLRRVLAEEAAAGSYRENFWKNAGRMEAVITRPAEAPSWSDNARQRFRADWERLYAGEAGSGKTAILEEGMEIKQMSFNAKDSQYIESRKLLLEEVAGAYHISAPMIGLLDEANFASVNAYHRMLYQDTLAPWLVGTEEELELQLLPEFTDVEDVYLEFNLQEKLKGSFVEEADMLQKATGRPYLTVNEARARRNLPTVEGGDDLARPLNLVVGQPGEEDSLSLTQRVEAATALIRAGFEPDAALTSVGLSPIEHLGLVPITVKDPEVEAAQVEQAKAHREAVERTLERAKRAAQYKWKSHPNAPTEWFFDPDRYKTELTQDLLKLGPSESVEQRMEKATEAVSVITQIALAEISTQLEAGASVEQAFDAALEALFKEELDGAA